VLTLERGGLENLWRRPFQYRLVPVSPSPPRVAWPRESFRPSGSLRLPASFGPKLGPLAGPRVFVAGTSSLVVTCPAVIETAAHALGSRSLDIDGLADGGSGGVIGSFALT
jgi:hypothetical protein